MKNVLLSAMLALLVCGSASAEEVRVFGQPLGGKVLPLKICPEDTSRQTQPCWVDRPFLYKGGRSGMVHLPDKAVPQWAAGYLPRASVDASGRLRSIEYGIIKRTDWEAAIPSISARFGAPIDVLKDQGASSVRAKWDRPDLVILSACYLNDCYIKFLSRLEKDERDKQKPGPVRPATP